MIKRIFLDMDGVLSNFVGAVATIFRTTEQELLDKWIPGEYDVCKILDISEERMWEMVFLGGEEFWSEMKPYPWAKELYELCCSIAPTVILTSPSREPNCLSGKVKWLCKNLGSEEVFRDFLIGPRKEMCAAPGHLLIDDYDNKCSSFIEHGGEAILFRRVWNQGRLIDDDPMEYIKTQLDVHHGIKL